MSPALFLSPLFGYLVSISLGQRKPIDTIIFSFVFALSDMLIVGYILSFLNIYGSIKGWTISLLISVLLAMIAVLKNKRTKNNAPLLGLFLIAKEIVKNIDVRFCVIEILIVLLCVITVTIVGTAGLWFALHYSPQNWDSLTYHLPRMAYYIQHGNLNPFGANYWAQVVHPRGSTNILTYLYLLSGSNECFTPLVQYISYWISALSISGTLLSLGASLFSSILSGLFFCLLTESLMESTTPQNDLLLCALISATIYGFTVWGKTGSRYHLCLPGICIAIALSIKASALLALPSCAIIFIFCSKLRIMAYDIAADFDDKCNRGRIIDDLVIFSISLVIAFALILLPSGYIDNIKAYGHPIGPAWVREIHSFEGMSAEEILKYGILNVLRFLSDFISFDGIPDKISSVPQLFFKTAFMNATNLIGVNMSEHAAIRAPFVNYKKPLSNEDFSYWGGIGFLLIWPINILLLLKACSNSVGKAFAIASVIFLFCQGFSGPYDPWRGRYFLICAPFALIALGTWISGLNIRLHRSVFMYLAVISMMTCFSAFYAVFSKDPVAPRILSQIDRIGQLTSRHPESYALPLRIYEHMIPSGSVVAVSLPEDSPEYLFFGERLNRRLIPINSFDSGMNVVLNGAQYLIYAAKTGVIMQVGDVDIGSGLYLRKLNQ